MNDEEVSRNLERARRIWFMKGAHLRPGEPGWLCFLGGDEYGNRTVALRTSPARYLVISLAFPLSHELENQ